MIAPKEPIPPARKEDIRRRVSEYLDKYDDVSQATIAKQTGTSKGTVSDVLRGKYGTRKGKPACDDTEYLRRFNNWMELGGTVTRAREGEGRSTVRSRFSRRSNGVWSRVEDRVTRC